MSIITTDELRVRFLRFFETKGHKIVASASLVPENDPTLLFTGSGMNQFKDAFLGNVQDFRRAATCQKCLRTPDLEKVGKTSGHHTFFEMLGNFSFGDYFKEEAITWAWEFLTEDMKIVPGRLWVSVYRDDGEACNIWRDRVRVPEGRIVKLGEKENFWPSNAPAIGPNGPCGPCSEIYYDRGVEYGCGKPDCGVSCDCGRFIEVWNLVFTQFNRRDGGLLDPLPNKNIDTGMGLERMASVLQGVRTNFEIDIFKPVIKTIESIIDNPEKVIESHAYINAIADHIRAVTFLIGDGVTPSNEGRGYVERMLIRRANRMGKSLGIDKPFLYKISPIVAQVMKGPYPELTSMRERISKVILEEEERFQVTLEDGTGILEKEIEILKREGKDVLSGALAFKLYDTYGFPLEITMDVAESCGLKVDRIGFDKAMDTQRRRSRAESKMRGEIFAETVRSVVDSLGKDTYFTGYIELKSHSKVVAIVKDNRLVDHAGEGEELGIVLDKTPFYGESGGQVGDTGALGDETARINVADTQRFSETIVHFGKLVKGSISVGDELLASIDEERRFAIARNHTATHLLQSALRKILGKHVEQSGSKVDETTLRFDFTHFKAPEPDELERVEKIVNENIRNGDKVSVETMSLDEAKKRGAIAIFGEKYGKMVRVVSVKDYSMELCGGTHVESTGVLGLFKITLEGSVGSGIRRIEARTGEAAYEWVREESDIINKVSTILKVPPDKIIQQTERILAASRELEKEVRLLKSKFSNTLIDEIITKATFVEGVKVITHKLEDHDAEMLRATLDLLKERLGSGVIVLGSGRDGKVSLVTGVTNDLVKKGLNAGNIVKEVAKITGGSGGGRADLAQAGGKYVERLDEALKAVEGIIKETVHEGNKTIK